MQKINFIAQSVLELSHRENADDDDDDDDNDDNDDDEERAPSADRNGPRTEAEPVKRGVPEKRQNRKREEKEPFKRRGKQWIKM